MGSPGSGVDPEWVHVATVSKLFVYPVKSFKGLEMDSYSCNETGVMITDSEVGDRTFMMVYEYGRFATQRQFPQMVLIQPSPVSTDKLRLEAPGMEPFEFTIPKHGSGKKVLTYKVFGDKCPGVDCGDEVAEWLATFLKVNTARLVFHNKELPANLRLKFQNFSHIGVYDKPFSSVFQDGCPFNMLSEASIEKLNSKLENKVTVKNFRTNLLLTDCKAFEEDEWRHIKIGSAEFLYAMPCTRCRVTTVDPETGIMDKDAVTLETLKKFRSCTQPERVLFGNSPKFSVQYLVIRSGVVNAGDKVYVNVNDKSGV